MDRDANYDHAEVMNELLALIGLIVLTVIGILLARLVRRDGLGSNPAPRSHAAELGTWVDRELAR
jgi:hypothetical protein